jgi:hypothetical protein
MLFRQETFAHDDEDEKRREGVSDGAPVDDQPLELEANDLSFGPTSRRVVASRAEALQSPIAVRANQTARPSVASVSWGGKALDGRRWAAPAGADWSEAAETPTPALDLNKTENETRLASVAPVRGRMTSAANPRRPRADGDRS